MRAGGCAVQQGLTSDSAAVVKQAVVLAKRRGHAQVTPLHVASTMLAAPAGLLRVACQRSNSHPLQCKALELCFNVALNRQPSSSPSHHWQYPSISNALVAAFKRAQAHQRRGSAENQQQPPPPLLTVKIELEQLVISILDDPSVSRVMREAGFSSTQVKINVEKAVSFQSTSPPPRNKSIKENTPFLSLQPSSPPVNRTEKKTAAEPTKNDDVGIIIETLLMNRKRSLVIVGESISTIESTVKDLMDRVDRGEVPEGLREVKFISIPPLYTFCNLQTDLVEQKMGELACLVRSLVQKGVVLYLGDLNWISEYELSLKQEGRCSSSVEHLIMEIGRLVCGIGETGRLWLMGMATFQTYMRCRNGYRKLESAWGLHPVTIPANTLGLSLSSSRDEISEARNGRAAESGSSQLLLTNEEVNPITCCVDCSSKLEAEALNKQAGLYTVNEPTLASRLRPWLKDERRKLCKDDQYCDSIRNLRMKWNSYCNSAHKQHGSYPRTLITVCSESPSSSSDKLQNPNTEERHCPPPDSNRIGLNSPSSIDVMDVSNYPQKFKEFNAQNLNMLCDALEEKVPWERQIIPEIAGTILECRSGMLRRKDKARSNSNGVKEETWLLFLGHDHRQGKQKICRELARMVFGSYSSFTSVGISSFNTRRDSNSPEDHRNKRGRDDHGNCSNFIEWLAHGVSTDPHRVFLVEDLDHVDYRSQMGIIQAVETGKIPKGTGEEVGFADAIVVLCSKGFSSRSEVVRKQTRESVASAAEEPAGVSVPLDLNMSVDEDSVENVDLATLENIVDRCVVLPSLGTVEY